MINVQVTGIKLDPNSITPDVVQAVSRAGTAVVGYARVELASKRIGQTGKLSQQIDSTVTLEGNRVVSRVVSRAKSDTGVPYGIFVHEGTQGPIRPRRARVLRFRGAGGAFVFAPQVRGTKQTGRFTPFLTDALKRLTSSDFR